MYEYKQFYRRTLPHIHSPGATLFVTFRLHGSIPKAVLRRWEGEKAELLRIISRVPSGDEASIRKPNPNVAERILAFNRQWFAEYEDVLHRAATGPVWLRTTESLSSSRTRCII